MEYLNLAETTFEKPVADYLRVSTVSPEVQIADVPANVQTIAAAYHEAQRDYTELLVTPELSLTGYSTADLFHNDYVLERSARGLEELAAITTDGPALVVGAPVVHQGLLYNCAVVMANGVIQGAVPKTHLPNYKEFYEQRWFRSGDGVVDQQVQIGDQEVPFGTDVLFDVNGTKVGVEICEDAWAPITPSAFATLNGAEVIVNLSASNELIGKPEYRRNQIVANLAGKLICAYVYASAGRGESVADVIYGGHQIIAENGKVVAERQPHSNDTSVMTYDIDRAYVQHDRLVNTTFAGQAAKFRQLQPMRTVPINVPRDTAYELLRTVEPGTFKPADQEALDKRCEMIITNLAQALAQRVSEKNSRALVLGLSGGLDSTLGLLIGVKACELLGKPVSFIHTITMQGPGSSDRTQDNASILANALGTTHKAMPIHDLTEQFLETIGYDGDRTDIAFENTQARTRTEILMNYANMVGGMVQGTGDLSENLIGWCTYNGDHMSMYNPNTGVPKTLVKELVSWYAEHRTSGEAQACLRDILDTPISPELLGNGTLSQKTEDQVGPYDLQEFFANEHARHGTRPTKIGYLATIAFRGIYDEETIARWLPTFLDRHTKSQWKRDVMPNGPKIGTVSDSPRGDLRMAPNTSPNWYK